MRLTFLILLAISLLPLTGCSRYVTKTDYKPAAEIPYDASPTPILFSDVELILPVGTDVGFESDGGRFCGWPRYPVSRTVLRDAVDTKYIRQTFHDALEAQGYDVVGSLDIAYDLEDEEARAEYSITAKIKNVELEMCHKEPDNFLIFFTTRRGTEGEFYMDVEWSVYDALRRTVVYKTKTSGYTKRRSPDQEGLTLMLTDAFEMAAHNLGTDPDFYDLIVGGVRPENWKRQRFDKQAENRKTMYDPQEQVSLPAQSLSKEPFTKNIDHKRKAAVMVQKLGHGSGFFITPQGHILTTADAVGDGARTRIVTANGKDKLTAEILRVDKVRNVALLRLEEIPDNLKIVTLPVRTEWPGVGEDVYLIGVPKDFRKMQDTLTKGIISAHRKNMKFNGVKQNYIQADVETQKGGAGGPLIDENGNIVGLAVGYYSGPEETAIGLNYFVPIAEALKALDIESP
ncbi:MAG: trypsin-like peptidase domain-containing protein [Rhodospirillales bacterium]|nr:trypsin-like peptidase domain-containing protein [Rhodospirillales bacterium]MCB9997046.1 trypsin-like peptidase domain-containing protein [Rhodospirillales bacterium]